MIERQGKPPKTERKFGDIWGEMAYVCKKTHYWLHIRGDKYSANRFGVRLKRVLDQLPENDTAIVRAEGLALLHELQGDMKCAVKYRRREIELMQALYEEAKNPRYDKRTRAFLLSGRGRSVLRERQKILRAIEEHQ